MIFDDLNDDNFLMFAMKEYNDIQCTNIEEFYDDLKKLSISRDSLIFTKIMVN